MVQIEVAAGVELEIAGGRTVVPSWHWRRTHWLAAPCPTCTRQPDSRRLVWRRRHVSIASHPPPPADAVSGGSSRTSQYRAVDCSSTSLDAVTTARLIIELAGAGTPLVATAVPGEVAELLGPDLVAAIEACAVEGLAEPRLRAPLRRPPPTGASPPLGVRESGRARSRARPMVSASPSVSILLATSRPEMVTFAIEQMAAQQYPNVEILCGLHGISLPPPTRAQIAGIAPHAQLIEIGTDHDLGQVLALLAERAAGDLVTKWDDDDWYATEHLLDLVAAMRYSGASVVASAEYVCLSSRSHATAVPESGRNVLTTIAGGTLMLTRSMLQAIEAGQPARDASIVCSSRRFRQLAARAIAYRVRYLLRRHSLRSEPHVAGRG